MLAAAQSAPTPRDALKGGVYMGNKMRGSLFIVMVVVLTLAARLAEAARF